MVSYYKLWRLLGKRRLQPRDLGHLAGISPSTIRALQKDQPVRLDVLERVCMALSVDIGEVCSFRSPGQR
ncbi:MAG: helix-turn-helix transcriptional regulator [Clostridia bacterium]|nr:helix-turn-helix transcriptional regulator [Clostridia bacterium]